MLLIFFSEISENYLENSAPHITCAEFLRPPLRTLRTKQINEPTPISIRIDAIRPVVAFARQFS